VSVAANIYGSGVGAFFTRNARLRAILAFVALLAFSFQGILVQSHFHNLGLSPGLNGAVSSGASVDGGKAPLDADKCPLCQEAIHAGHYLLPAAAAAAAVFFAGFAPVAAVRSVVLLPPCSHAWLGRAPPASPTLM
jgi:hypothetical protein